MRRIATTALLAAARISRRSDVIISSSLSSISRYSSLNSPAAFTAAAASRSFSNSALFSTSLHGGSGEIDEDEGDESVDGDDDEGWEEEEEVEAKLGDGGDGGGIVLRDVAWGERALSLAREILARFDEDTVLYAFKVSPKGYIYVRLDKLTHIYGCLDMEEMTKFNNLYKERLDEVGLSGEIPDNLALEVSSPGAERILKVPEDLDRFKEMPMWVHYLEQIPESQQHQQSAKVLMLESIDHESQQCVWKLANVKENREQLGKGRPLNRKQKDWRLTVVFGSIEKVQLYLDA